MHYLMNKCRASSFYGLALLSVLCYAGAMWYMAKKIMRSFINALYGIKQAYMRDLSFRIEIWGSILLLAFIYYFWPLAYDEFLFLVLAYALVLITELINTAFERALERLHPDHHELIGISKDIASGAVFVAVCFTLLVAGIIVWEHAMF